MRFFYEAYEILLSSLKNHDYAVVDYHNWERDKKKCVILRHDIDYSIDKALTLAKIEANGGVRSTYFVMVTSDMYNIHSLANREMLKQICNLGHEVGIHFDEAAYPDAIGKPEEIKGLIIHEGKLLSDLIEQEVATVSMHRPSKGILKADIQIPGFVNSYSNIFFHDFKYVSDSRRRWREPVEEYIERGTYDRLHILTHAFWYNDSELDMHDTIEKYVNSGNRDRYEILNRNFTNLEDAMGRNEIR